MKKIEYYAMLVCLLTSTSTLAQTEKGNFILGSTFEITNAKHSPFNDGFQPDGSSFGFGINPGVSYFFIDKFSLGLITPFAYGKVSNKDSSTSSRTTNYALGTRMRYYFLFDQLAVFPELSYAWGIKTVKRGPNDALAITQKTTAYTWDAGVGISYFFSKNTALEAVMLFQKEASTFIPVLLEYKSTTTSILFQVGFQIYLKPKKSNIKTI